MSGGAKPAEVRAVVRGTESLTSYLSMTDAEVRSEGLPVLRPGDLPGGEWWALCPGDEDWPRGLEHLSSPPGVLFGVGEKSSLHRCVAAVGTRRMSRIGESAAEAVAEAGLAVSAAVVSGLAVGCDTAAHEAALKSGCLTVAVIPTWVRDVYPAANRDLVERILESNGAVVSENLPGSRPTPANLFGRNRLIAALGWLMVPCEGDRGSNGTMNAVTNAVKLDRPVVVPQVRGRWRNHPGAWLLEQLGSDHPESVVAKIRKDTSARRFPIANAVCENREDMKDAFRVLMHFTPLS